MRKRRNSECCSILEWSHPRGGHGSSRTFTCSLRGWRATTKLRESCTWKRSATTRSAKIEKAADSLETYHLKTAGSVLVSGSAVGEEISVGPVCRISSSVDLAKFRDGNVLVTDKTDPDWEPVMKRAAAIVTDRGGRTCHAAIVSRELGLPAIVGLESPRNDQQNLGWICQHTSVLRRQTGRGGRDDRRRLFP